MIGRDDGCHDVAAECGTDLHEFVLVELLVDLVIEVVDSEVGAVCGESGELFGGDARGELTSLHRCAEEQDVRFVFADEIHNDLGERENRERFETRVVCEEDLFASVFEEGFAAVFDIGAEEDAFDVDSELGGEFRALADEFQTDVRDLSAFLLNKNPDISNLFRHVNHPNVWSSMSS